MSSGAVSIATELADDVRCEEELVKSDQWINCDAVVPRVLRLQMHTSVRAIVQSSAPNDLSMTALTWTRRATVIHDITRKITATNKTLRLRSSSIMDDHDEHQEDTAKKCTPILRQENKGGERGG